MRYDPDESYVGMGCLTIIALPVLPIFAILWCIGWCVVQVMDGVMDRINK